MALSVAHEHEAGQFFTRTWFLESQRYRQIHWYGRDLHHASEVNSTGSESSPALKPRDSVTLNHSSRNVAGRAFPHQGQ